jgi:Tryptophan-rich sensory protein (mitochondrial benzodiazepine receptor homolog)
MKKNILGIIVGILVCELAGAIGAFFTMPNIPIWYAGLVKTPLNPPNWIFGPVWTILFALMGVAMFLIWEKGGKNKTVAYALNVFALQFVLNIWWSVIFFGMKNPTLALWEIFAFWLAIIWTIVLFWKISRPAAYVLLPYILWVSFAAYLNYSIVVLN